MGPRQHQREGDREDSPRPSRYPSPIGHWTRTLGALAPLVITELIPEDRVKQRFIRIASVALAAISEASYAYQIQRERREHYR